MTSIIIPYEPRDQQLALHDIQKRWLLTICHRRFGKTVYAVNKLIKANFTCPLDRPRHAYIAPYLKQAKQIAWDYLKLYSRPIPGIEINEAELRIDYPNGGRIRLYGADNPDSLRGIYLDGVVYDEYAQIPPKLHSEVIRPALSDRKGWGEFMGTPKGRNHFHDLYESIKDNDTWAVTVYKASETGLVDAEELESARDIMTDDEYNQEYECSFTAAVQGAYFTTELNKIRANGQICRIPVENVEVNTFWDLGRNDTTVIWFHQRIGKENRFIDFFEANGEGLEFYARILKDKGYLYGTHYLPHDVNVTDLSRGDNKSRKQILESLGVTPINAVPRVSDVNKGIEQTRQMIPTCWFDEEKCKEGLKALEGYCKVYDERNQVFRNNPLHNWCSNPADAFRQFGQGYRDKPKWGKLDYNKVAIA